MLLCAKAQKGSDPFSVVKYLSLGDGYFYLNKNVICARYICLFRPNNSKSCPNNPVFARKSYLELSQSLSDLYKCLILRLNTRSL